MKKLILPLLYVGLPFLVLWGAPGNHMIPDVPQGVNTGFVQSQGRIVKGDCVQWAFDNNNGGVIADSGNPCGTGTGTGGGSLPTATAAGQVPVSTGAGTSYNATYLGVPTRASTCAGNTDTILATDRAGYVSENDASACAVTLPQAGSAGFTSNFVYTFCNQGAGAVTITPTVSTITIFGGGPPLLGQASAAFNQGQCGTFYSDNTNYFLTYKGGTNYPDITDTAGTSVSFSVPTLYSVDGSAPAGSPTGFFRKSAGHIICMVGAFGDACDVAFDANRGTVNVAQRTGFTWVGSATDASSATPFSYLGSPTSGIITAGIAAQVGGQDIQGTFLASNHSIADDGNPSGAAFISFGSRENFTTAGCETSYGITTVSTASATTTTGLNCLPLNAVVDAVVYRITTTITTAASFTIGVSGTAAKFCATQSTLTAGTTGSCLAQTGTAGALDGAAAPVVVTFNATPGAGAMRLIVYYHTFIAPTS